MCVAKIYVYNLLVSRNILLVSKRKSQFPSPRRHTLSWDSFFLGDVLV